MGENRYFVYGRSDCNFCTLAVDYFLASRRTVIFFDFREEREFLEEVKEFYSSKTVPIILENNTVSGKVSKIGGYTDLVRWFEGD